MKIYSRYIRIADTELLLKHIRPNNEVGTPFKELQQVLPGLKEDGKVICKGKTGAARWFIIK